MELLGYIASIFMGLSLGMIGGGGSILTVPILVYLFGINPILATAYSLFIVGLTALFGGVGYLKKGEVDLKTGFIFAVPSFVGVYLTRRFVIPNLPDPVFSVGEMAISKSLLIMLVFAVLMLAASISMIKARKPATAPKAPLSPAMKFGLISLEGLVVGGVTGFVGAGGGFLIIPALVVLVGMPMKIAVGTSLFIIAAKSLIGFIGDLQGTAVIDWKLMLTVAAIAIVGLFIGMNLSKKVSETALKKGFGYFVLIMGAFILFDQIKRM
ncbi:MAG: sulfite exporter TauE/SafE family protein [Bdellovibrionales bacterium]|nr:sulfite exporter TauE/SafE family protein [Bdellovibrionales bacterium]